MGREIETSSIRKRTQNLSLLRSTVMIAISSLLLLSSLFVIELHRSNDYRITGKSGNYSLEGSAFESVELLSPGGALKVCLWIFDISDESNCPLYNVSYKGRTIVNTSRLGLMVEGEGKRLCTGMKIVDYERSVKNESFSLAVSDCDRSHWQYNQLNVTLKSDDGISMVVRFRAYNEGVTFSYNVDKIRTRTSCRITREATSFNVSGDSKCYAEYGVEEPYKKIKITELKKECEIPLLIEEKKGCWLTISEAGLQDYSRTHIGPGSLENGTIATSLHSSVSKKIPFETPWRMILFSDSPCDMVENGRICYSMCPENTISDTSWIRPGKAFRDCSLTTKGSKEIIDYCAYQGLEYVHLDAGWYGKETSSSSDASTVSAKDLNLTEVISYGKSKGIGVIVYVNKRALTRQYKEIFPLYKEWGIAGVKFGFIDGRSQAGINFVHKAVKEAAKNNLIVDVHDNYRPTGMSRTYPNLLTQEGVRGNEQFPYARENTILPFSRCIAGPTDYTPIFGTKESRTTLAHQLALPIVIYSPLHYIYWYGTVKKAGNTSVNTIWKDLPTVWNETKFIEGYPGSHAVVARRSSDIWYVGAINGPSEKTIKIPLDFLKRNRTYRVRTFKDPGDSSVEVSEFVVNSGTTMLEKIPKNSGFSLIITEFVSGPPTGDEIYPPRLNDMEKLKIMEDSTYCELLLADNGWKEVSLQYDNLPGFLRLSNEGRYLNAEPGNEDVGNYSIVFNLTLKGEILDQMELEIDVVNVNDPPVIDVPKYVTMNAGESYCVPLEATDIDPTDDELVWEILSKSDFFIVDKERNLLFANPEKDDEGVHEIDLKVSDGNGGFDETLFYTLVTRPKDSVFILPVNGSLQLNEGQHFNYRFHLSSNRNIDDLDWSIENGPQFVSIDGSGLIFGQAGPYDAGIYQFEIRIIEGSEILASAPFTIVVQKINDPPRIITNPTLVELDAGSIYRMDLKAEDPDLTGDLKWSLLESPGFIGIESDTGELVFEPVEGDSGFHELLIRVEDDEGGMDELVLAVFVKIIDDDNDIKKYEYTGKRVRVIPVEVSSSKWYEKLPEKEDTRIVIYYPVEESDSKGSDNGSGYGYIALFVIVVSALSVIIHLFLRK